MDDTTAKRRSSILKAQSDENTATTTNGQRRVSWHATKTVKEYAKHDHRVEMTPQEESMQLTLSSDGKSEGTLSTTQTTGTGMQRNDHTTTTTFDTAPQLSTTPLSTRNGARRRSSSEQRMSLGGGEETRAVFDAFGAAAPWDTTVGDESRRMSQAGKSFADEPTEMLFAELQQHAGDASPEQTKDRTLVGNETLPAEKTIGVFTALESAFEAGDAGADNDAQSDAETSTAVEREDAQRFGGAENTAAIFDAFDAQRRNASAAPSEPRAARCSDATAENTAAIFDAFDAQRRNAFAADGVEDDSMETDQAETEPSEPRAARRSDATTVSTVDDVGATYVVQRTAPAMDESSFASSSSDRSDGGDDVVSGMSQNGTYVVCTGGRQVIIGLDETATSGHAPINFEDADTSSTSSTSITASTANVTIDDDDGKPSPLRTPGGTLATTDAAPQTPQPECRYRPMVSTIQEEQTTRDSSLNTSPLLLKRLGELSEKIKRSAERRRRESYGFEHSYPTTTEARSIVDSLVGLDGVDTSRPALLQLSTTRTNMGDVTTATQADDSQRSGTPEQSGVRHVHGDTLMDTPVTRHSISHLRGERTFANRTGLRHQEPTFEGSTMASPSTASRGQLNSTFASKRTEEQLLSATFEESLTISDKCERAGITSKEIQLPAPLEAKDDAPDSVKEECARLKKEINDTVREELERLRPLVAAKLEKLKTTNPALYQAIRKMETSKMTAEQQRHFAEGRIKATGRLHELLTPAMRAAADRLEQRVEAAGEEAAEVARLCQEMEETKAFVEKHRWLLTTPAEAIRNWEAYAERVLELKREFIECEKERLTLTIRQRRVEIARYDAVIAALENGYAEVPRDEALLRDAEAELRALAVASHERMERLHRRVERLRATHGMSSEPEEDAVSNSGGSSSG